MAGILPGGGSDGGGGSGLGDPVFEESHDFSTGDFTIPSGDREQGLILSVQNDSGSDLPNTSDGLTIQNDAGATIAGITYPLAAGELQLLSKSDRTPATIIPMGTDVEIQTIVRGYSP